MTGVDIVDLSRIPLSEAFIHRILTEEEISQYRMRKNDSRRREFLGGRFACKEAIFKATGDKEYLSYSILNDESGKPYVLDHPEMEVSISHDAGIAIAVILIKA